MNNVIVFEVNREFRIVPLGNRRLANRSGNLLRVAETVSNSGLALASPGQVVIAGDKVAVERAITAAKDAGAKRALLLPVSVPSHCLLMREAAEAFAENLNAIQFNDADTPVIQNVDAQLRTSAEEIRPILLEQLYKPVRWVSCIETMKSNNISSVIECGPGKVLAGLIKRIDRSLDIGFIQDEKSLEAALA